MRPERVARWIESFNVPDKELMHKNVIGKEISGNILCHLTSAEVISEELDIPSDIAQHIFDFIKSLKEGARHKLLNRDIDSAYSSGEKKKHPFESYEKIPPDFYEILEESLETAEFENVKSLMKYSMEIARYVARKGLLCKLKMTQADSMALSIYTYDFGQEHFEDNPYRVINKVLGERNTVCTLRLRGYILRLLAALRKLPPYIGVETLYRAVTNVSENYMKIGNVLTWPAFTSTSSDENSVIDFFRKIAVDGDRYIFEITGCFKKGHSIRDFSFHSDEDGKFCSISSNSFLSFFLSFFAIDSFLFVSHFSFIVIILIYDFVLTRNPL